MNSNSKPDCADILSQLPLYVGGELEDDPRSRVDRHLASGCVACSDAHRRAQDAREAYLRGVLLEVDEEPPSLWPGIRSRLHSEGVLDVRAAARASAAGRLHDARPAPWRRASGWGLVAAAAAVVLLVRLTGSPAERPGAGGGRAEAGPGVVDAQPVSAGRAALPALAPAASAPTNDGLRPSLAGEERLAEEVLRGPFTHPQLPGSYEVVSDGKLR